MVCNSFSLNGHQTLSGSPSCIKWPYGLYQPTKMDCVRNLSQRLIIRKRLAIIIRDKNGVQADPAQSSESKDDSITNDEFCGSVENLATESPADVGLLSYGTRMRRRGKGSGNSLPVITIEPRVHHVFRYKRNDSANSYTVDVGDIAKAIVAASSATTYRYIIRTFRVKKVTIRGSTSTIGASATVGLRYLGSNTNELNYQDVTMKIDNNAVVTRAPPRFSLASFWHDVTSDSLDTELFQLSYFGDGACFVDLQLEFLLDVDRYVNFTLSGGTGLDVGGLYKGSLAGLDAIGGVRLQ